MNLNLHQLSSDITARAAVLFVTHRSDSWEECRKMAAQMIAAERKAEAKRSKRALLPLSIPTSHDAGLEGELATAKERFFAKLTAFFQRHDANVAREKRARIEAKRQAKKQSLPRVRMMKPAPAPQPDPLPDNVHAFPLVYGGAGQVSTSQHIDESMFPPKFSNPATREWQRQQEELKRKGQN